MNRPTYQMERLQSFLVIHDLFLLLLLYYLLPLQKQRLRLSSSVLYIPLLTGTSFKSKSSLDADTNNSSSEVSISLSEIRRSLLPTLFRWHIEIGVKFLTQYYKQLINMNLTLKNMSCMVTPLWNRMNPLAPLKIAPPSPGDASPVVSLSQSVNVA